MKKEFERQKKFTEHIWDKIGAGMPEDINDRIKLTKEYVLSLIAECIEVLNALDWKTQWKEDKETDRINIAFELIDLQKFLFGLASIWGISYDEYVDIFNQKSNVVEQKFDQEQALKCGKFSKICVIDIDGVISDYPKCYYDWALANEGVSENELKQNRILNEKIKNLYRFSGAKRYLPIKKGAKKALSKLKGLGYCIILLTKRPYNRYSNIYSDTLFWLKNNKISFDYIMWSEDDVPKILSAYRKAEDIAFVADDSLEVCVDFAKLGVKTYLISQDPMSLEKIIVVEGLLNIDEIK